MLKSATREQFRRGILRRIEETTKNPEPREIMRPVLKSLLGVLDEKQTERGVVVTLPPMFRSLALTVAKVDGVWYLVELP